MRDNRSAGHWLPDVHILGWDTQFHVSLNQFSRVKHRYEFIHKILSKYRLDLSEEMSVRQCNVLAKVAELANR